MITFVASKRQNYMITTQSNKRSAEVSIQHIYNINCIVNFELWDVIVNNVYCIVIHSMYTNFA